MTGEHETLVATIDYLRRSFLRNLDGLDDTAVRSSPVPSGTSLRGLVEHLSFVETYWLAYVFAGGDDHVFEVSAVAPEAGLDDVLAAHARATAVADDIAAAGDLDARSARPGVDDDPVTLRWILVHLIEEIARHAGHADIIREQIDGSVGR